MIVCADCGEHNPDSAEFCGACGVFLEWEREPARTTGQPAAAQQQPTGQQPAGQQPIGQQPAGQQPVGRQPAAQQPTEQVPPPARHQPRLTERRAPRPGELICGQCGEGNLPSRRFCGRCGESLQEAEVVAQPWWRRFVPGRGPEVRQAGTRPRKRRGGVRRGIGKGVRWALVAVLLITGGLYGLHAPFRTAVNERATSVARDVEGVFVTRLTPVRPTEVTATAQAADHPAGLVSDNASNTYWLAPAEPQPALVLAFGKQVDLRKAIVRVGIGENFQAAHRPQKLHLVYSTGRTFDVTLADTPDAQEVALAGSEGADRLELHVVGLHRSLQGNDIALSEIEFFARE